MVVMEAVMVQLPFANSFGANSLLNELVESDVDVKTFGSDTVATGGRGGRAAERRGVMKGKDREG